MNTHPNTKHPRSELFRRPLLLALLPAVMMIAAACGPGSSSPSAQHPSASAVEWPQANHDLANTRNATGTTISSSNVKKLGVDWTFSVGGASAYGALATTPIVVDGVAYLENLQSDVYAIDLRTGTLRWQKLFGGQSVGPNGVAFDNGTLFATSDMHTVVALDAKSGKEIWSKQVGPSATQGITQQLTAHAGTLYVSTIPGSSLTSFYVGGDMGVLHALDERTGNDLWTFNTVKDGDLWGNAKVNSGGGAWYPPAIDASTGTTYWGIGNPAPYPGTKEFPNGSSRPGPNLYTDSALAIDRSGHLQWYRQVQAHDLFDHDFEASPILATTSVNGDSRQIVIGAGKGGYVVAFDRRTGEQLWKTPVGLHHNDGLTTIPAGKKLSVLPGTFGGVETPMALEDGVVYVPVVNLATDYKATGTIQPDVSTGTGELDAIDVNTGRLLWTAKLGASDYGGALTAGDLVFTSTFTGQVLAFDRASGEQVWSWQAPGGINSPLSLAGDTLLVPVGVGARPMLVALKLGATGTIPAATPSATPSTSVPTSSPSTTASGTALQISTPDKGDGILFDTKQLAAPAGAHVTLTYSNDTAITHNWHLFDGPDASATSIASTQIKAGPNDVERVSFTAPMKPGRYYFQCDVHPTIMRGFLVVR